ncbi:MAG TPA: alpha/beta hydrolase [Pseudonocardia sp.]
MASAESKIIVDMYDQLGATLVGNPGLPLGVTRAVMDSAMVSVASEPEGVTYEGVSAGGVPALWCIPAGCSQDRVIMYTHGGGYVGGSTVSHRRMTGHLARAAGVRVLSLDYALAPEHPHPAASDDALAGYRWLRSQGFAADHIAVSGDSAGGGLCTALVLRLREAGEDLPAAVMPLSPWYDMELVGESLVASRGSGTVVSADGLMSMVQAFLQGASPKDPVANPLYADLTGFPPVLIHVGAEEALVSDSETFARNASAVGVDVTLVVEPEMLHVYPFGAGRMPEADAAIARMASWVRARLGLDGAPGAGRT